MTRPPIRYLVVGAGRSLVGVLMTARPRALLDEVDGRPAPRLAAGLAAVLGLRELVQGGLLAATRRATGGRRRTLVDASLVIDASHLVTMIIAALPRSRYRRAATAAAVAASADILSDLALRAGER